MPLYAGELNLRRGATLEEYPAPLSEALRAQAQQTMHDNPTSILRSMADREAANRGEFIGNTTDQYGAVVPQFQPPKVLDADTARARVKEEGLPLTIPDEGIAEPALDILINAKRAELQRESVLSRGPSGFLPGTARLATAFAASLYDPLNIASAFIPVVGEARYARLLAGASGAFGRAGVRAGVGAVVGEARYARLLAGASGAFGRAGVRAGVGAVEGAAGAAMLEPLVYFGNQAEQADYDMADSLANIAFGALFGGGLHAGGGAIRDAVQPGWWRLATPTETPTRIDADSPALRALDAVPSTREPLRAAGAMDAIEAAQRIADVEAKPGFQRTAEDLIALKVDRTPEIDRAVEILKQPAFERSAEDRVFLAALEKGKEADYVNDRIGDLLRRMSDIDDTFLARGNSLQSEGALSLKAPMVQEMEAAVQRLAQLGQPVDQARLVMERVSPETRQAALKAAVVQAVEGRQTTVDELVKADRGARMMDRQARLQAASDLRAAAARSQRPDAIRSAEPRSSAAADQTMREAKPGTVEDAQAELDAALAAADDFAEALGQPERVKEGMKEFDAAIKRADDYEKALRAGAACGLA